MWLPSCEFPQAASWPESGVSRELARERKTALSNLSYRLFFDIPADLQDSIPASATVRFTHLHGGQRVVLDFREEGEKVLEFFRRCEAAGQQQLAG